MYNDIYEESQEATMQVSLVQGLLISITVLVTLILPTQFIMQSQNPPAPNDVYTASALREREGGQVAGVETDAWSIPSVYGTETETVVEEETESNRTITFPIINTSIDLDSETGILILSGTVLIIFALLLLIYYVISSANRGKRKR